MCLPSHPDAPADEADDSVGARQEVLVVNEGIDGTVDVKLNRWVLGPALTGLVARSSEKWTCAAAECTEAAAIVAEVLLMTFS